MLLASCVITTRLHETTSIALLTHRGLAYVHHILKRYFEDQFLHNHFGILITFFY